MHQLANRTNRLPMKPRLLAVDAQARPGPAVDCIQVAVDGEQLFDVDEVDQLHGPHRLGLTQPFERLVPSGRLDVEDVRLEVRPRRVLFEPVLESDPHARVRNEAPGARDAEHEDGVVPRERVPHVVHFYVGGERGPDEVLPAAVESVDRSEPAVAVLGHGQVVLQDQCQLPRLVRLGLPRVYPLSVYSGVKSLHVHRARSSLPLEPAGDGLRLVIDLSIHIPIDPYFHGGLVPIEFHVVQTVEQRHE